MYMWLNFSRDVNNYFYFFHWKNLFIVILNEFNFTRTDSNRHGLKKFQCLTPFLKNLTHNKYAIYFFGSVAHNGIHIHTGLDIVEVFHFISEIIEWIQRKLFFGNSFTVDEKEVEWKNLIFIFMSSHKYNMCAFTSKTRCKVQVLT
jgi:type II secretory pathway component PulF